MGTIKHSSPAPLRRLRRRAVGIITRLFVWYAIVTVIFRCPQTLEDLSETSPSICRPYLQGRGFIEPHVLPHYDSYARPYVELIHPYWNTLYTRAYVPTSTTAHKIYTSYAAPLILKSWQYGESELDRILRPLWATGKDRALAQYDVYLRPTVAKVGHVTSPIFDRGRNLVRSQYDSVLVPAYEGSMPYIQLAYGMTKGIANNTVIPYGRIALHSTVAFVRRKVWPAVRVLYGRNVEPQLSKIKERLSSYRDGKKLEALMDEPLDITSSFHGESPLTAYSETTTQPFTSTFLEATPTINKELSSSATSVASTEVTDASSVMTMELMKWQAKFSRASDQGAEDLAKRISQIAHDEMVTSVSGLGSALLTRLEEAASSVLASLRAAILDSVLALPSEPSQGDENSAFDSIVTKIRAAGSTIKDKAQELRVWKVKYNHNFDLLVQAASDSTLDVIDGIRDLGLQEIGMRWASMDDATYQDWAEYHKLKKTMDEWRVKISDVATQHEAVAMVKAAADEIEDNGMAMAQSAAKELAMLKDVARWKIHARDATDDFAPRALPAAAVRLGQKIMAKVSTIEDALVGTTSTPDMVESIMLAVTEGASSIVSKASVGVVDPILDVAPAFEIPGTQSVVGGVAEVTEAIADYLSSAAPGLNVPNSDDAIRATSRLSDAFERSVSDLTESAGGVATGVFTSASGSIEEILSSFATASSSTTSPTDASSSSLLSAMSAAAASATLDTPSGALSEDVAEDDLESASMLSFGSSVASMATAEVGRRAQMVGTVLDEARITASTLVHDPLDEIVGEPGSTLTSMTGGSSDIVNAAKQSMASAGTIVADAAADVSSDIIDRAMDASQSVKILIEEAGTAYESVTSRLATGMEA